jgi:hypothetical protein
MNRRRRRSHSGWLVLGLAVAACKDSAGPEPDGGNARLIDSTLTVPSPQLVREVAIPTSAPFIHDTFVRDGIVFVCAWNNGLILYDVGNGIKGGSPSNPVEISRIVTAQNGIVTSNGGGADVHNAWWFHNPVTSEKKYVFVGQEGPGNIGESSNGDIHVVDISNINSPVEVAFYHMNASPSAGTHNFWMDEPAQILYAAYYNGGVVAIDVSGTLTGDLASREIARIKPAGSSYMWGVQLSGGSIYATDMVNGLSQIRLTGSTLSVVGSGTVTDRFSSDLWVRGQNAYTGTWGSRNGIPGNALKTWNLGSGGAPTLADSVIIAGIGTVSDVKGTEDGKLLVATAENGSWGGLYVFSLADPVRPSLVGRARVQSGLHTVKIGEIGGRKYAFAARNVRSNLTSALMIFDITALAP